MIGPPKSVVVVGGGIAGLAAAWRLSGEGHSVLVLEREARPGGQIRTERAGEWTFEGGADSFVTQKPAAVSLCARLSLSHALEEPDPRRAGTFVVRNRRLQRVPDGFSMLAPTRLLPALRTPLLSWRGKLRMALEPVLPPRREAVDDEALATFVRRRFGREVLERLAEPIVGGVCLADVERMSVRMTMPRLLDLERRRGGVTRAFRRAAAGATRGPIVTLRGGLGTLVDALVGRLPAAALRTSVNVEGVERRTAQGDWRVRLQGEAAIVADSVLLACPAYEAARILRRVDADLAATLDELAYVPCATVNLAYRADDLARPLSGFGFFVPRTEAIPVLACSFVSEKFPGRAPAGAVLLRVFLGGALRPADADGDDAALTRRAHEGIRGLLSIRGEPLASHVTRYPHALPQWEVGASRWLREVAAKAAALPGLHFAGSVTGAVGIPDSISSAEAAADRISLEIGRVRSAGDVA